MRVTLNGKPFEHAGPQTLEALLKSIGALERPAVAAAVNGHILRRADWPEVALAEGDEVDVVSAAAGG